jgi:hypothetical protein
MRRNLAVLVCAAGCVCLVGCHSFDRTDDSSMNTSMQSRTLSDTGTTGSSASPYTQGRAQYHYPADTGYTGSSAAPNTYYRGNDTSHNNTYYRDDTRTYDTRPGMVKDKDGNCVDK